MALGFFILGPRIRMSGQIGVPSILGASQNLGDPAPPLPQEIVSVVVMRKSDWQIFVIQFTKLYGLFFASLGNKNTMYS